MNKKIEPCWLTVNLGNDRDNAHWPEWQRTLYFDGDRFFAAAVLTGLCEGDALLAATFDGIGFAGQDRHLYLPVDWMAMRYPNSANWASLKEILRRTRLDLEEGKL